MTRDLIYGEEDVLCLLDDLLVDRGGDWWEEFLSVLWAQKGSVTADTGAAQ